nr:hypothetical protein [Pantoea sp. M_5]
MLQKFRQAGKDKTGRHRDGHIDPQLAAERGGIVLEQTVHIVDHRQQVQTAIVIDQSILSQLHPARGAMQQTGCHLILQRLYLPRYAAFRHA